RPGSSTTTPLRSPGRATRARTAQSDYQCGGTSRRRRSSFESSWSCQPTGESSDERFGTNGGEAAGDDGGDEVGRIEPRGERPAGGEAAGEEAAGEAADGLPVPFGEPGGRSLGATGRSVWPTDEPPAAESVALV